jgi:hypothetical protein
MPGGIALLGVNGVPTFLLLSAGLFDAGGDFTLTVPPMPSLSGLVLTLAGGGVLANGFVDVSPFVDVTFR